MGKRKHRSRSFIKAINEGRKAHTTNLCLCGFDLRELPADTFEEPFPECLEHLDMSNNRLEYLCNEVGMLTNLKILILSGNMLTQIPDELGLLRQLIQLDLSRNQLKTLPRAINKLKELEKVNLSGNSLKIIPEYLLSLPKLLKVFCIRNPCLENIPKTVAADGLEAMRKYLKIKVEEYEIFLEERKNDSRQKFDLIMEEIEKDWILEDEQFVRKTKDACTQLDEEEEHLLSCTPKRSLDDSFLERSSSTQTETNEDEEHEQMEILSLGESQSSFLWKKESNQKGERSPNMESFDEGKALENLVKIFRRQICLVSENRTSFLLDKMKRKKSSSSSFGQSLCDSSCFYEAKTDVRMCNCCGQRKRGISTSEYGSMSACSVERGGLFADQDDDSCDGNDGSEHENLSDLDLEDVLQFDEFTDDSSEYSDDDFWSLSQKKFINACNELEIRQYGINLKIPEMNLSGHPQSEFSFQVMSEIEFSPILEDNMLLATPIVHVTPHGAKFYSSSPATIQLPLNIVVENDVKIKCFVSDTGINANPVWEEIKSENFDVSCGFVKIRTNHFSLFCATALKEYPFATKRIPSLTGGQLNVEEVKGLQVNFTEKSLSSDIDASATVLFNDPKYKPNHNDRAIATPIVALGPDGASFEDDVKITLPLPNAQKVYHIAGNPRLIIMESRTALNENPSWKELQVPYEVKHDNGLYTVTFSVRHFTVFSVLWDVLRSTVDTVSRFIPLFTHLVYFQALMSDCHHNNQFGLCIICHHSGNPPITDCSQFPIDVGTSKPREIKKGKVIIELKSTLFKADESVGEAIGGLVKTETFTGLEFEKQFALRFHDPFKDGIFGKVKISRKDNANTDSDVTDFVLQKASQRRRNLGNKMPTELETAAVKEIAGLLSIEDRWKELGMTLGYTRREINTKFDIEDPIEEILTDYMSRGGDADKFIRAMYEVGRRLKLIPFDQMMENRENRKMESRDETRSSHFCNCPPTPEKTPIRIAKRKLADRAHEEEESLTDAKLDQIAGQISKSWKHVGRNLGIGEKKLAEIDQTNQNEGEREKAFQMFMVWREMDPDSFSVENLGRALCKCDLKYTARQFLSY